MTNSQFYELIKEGLTAINAPEEAFEKIEKMITKETGITEKGAAILEVMKANPNEVFTAAAIGEKLGLTSRSVSGSMRKLVSNEYVEKVGQNPVCYQLLDK